MLGAIAGDIIGSVYEWSSVKTTGFALFSPHSRFTDDTVLTVVVADCILNGRDYAAVYREYGRRYPDAVSLGGDSDTLACIAGGIAHAYYKVIPSSIVEKVRRMLPAGLLDITDRFCRKYEVPL